MRITSQKGFSGINETAKLSDSFGNAVGMNNLQISNSGSMKRRKGIAHVCSMEDADIEGIWSGTLRGEETVVFTAGGKLYKITPHTIDAVPEFVANLDTGEAMMFEFNGLLYIKIGSSYHKYNGSSIKSVDGYIPLVALSCTPEGEGELFEQINLICDKRRQLFSADGNAQDYYLAEKAADGIISVEIDGKPVGGYTLDESGDFVHFETAPEKGLNNVEITYSKANDDKDRIRIFGCRKVMRFGGNSDGRIFLWGNDEFPNYRFHSELANGVPSVEYFPVNAYTVIGNNKINCIVQQYDKQLIFTENEAFYSFCELRDDGLGNIYSSFPVYSLNGEKGCLIETWGCVIDNRPVTLCNDGLNMWESTSLPDEKNAVCFSMPIDESIRKIVIEDKSELSMFDFQSNRELFFISGDTAYIYNYGNGAWYIYDQFQGKHYTVCGTALYFSRDNSIYMFSDDLDISGSHGCLWESPFITLGQHSGRADITNFEADIYIKGPISLSFTFEKSTGGVAKRDFEFSEGEEGFRRIFFRPRIKRGMPFRLSVNQTDKGEFSLHGMTVKTREKERSGRFGIL